MKTVLSLCRSISRPDSASNPSEAGTAADDREAADVPQQLRFGRQREEERGHDDPVSPSGPQHDRRPRRRRRLRHVLHESRHVRRRHHLVGGPYTHSAPACQSSLIPVNQLKP